MKDLIEAMIRNKLDDSVTVKGVRIKKGFSFVNPDFNPASEEEAFNKKTEERKEASDRFVFASFICEYEFHEDKFTSNSEFLGIFTDPKKAEKICDDCCPMQWTPIKAIPVVENKNVYKIKGEYFIDDDFMVLTIRNRIILLVELDKFNGEIDLSYCNYVDQNDYLKILGMFNDYRAENNKSLSKLRNGIHKLFE